MSDRVENMRRSSEYTCPNGHEFPAVFVGQCLDCGAGVACEPAAKGMALARQLEGAVERAERAERKQFEYAARIDALDAENARLHEALGYPDNAGGR